MSDEIVTIERWDGREMHGVRSRGSSVFAALDWRDLVLATGSPIEAKAVLPSKQLRSFSSEAQRYLTQCDGRYCDLQSINSEDTVTWSVFGVCPVELWAGDLLNLAFGQMKRPSNWTVRFWARLSHPETGVTGHGPEADLTLEADGDWFFAIEAKWRNDIS